MRLIYAIDPLGKPRMTRRSMYVDGKLRPPVARYMAFKDLVRTIGVHLPECYHVTFVFEMPKSWSQAKRERMRGQPHTQKPDKDNCEKALHDALLDDDAKVWDGRVSKFWGEAGMIVVEEIEGARCPV